MESEKTSYDINVVLKILTEVLDEEASKILTMEKPFWSPDFITVF